MRYPFKITPSLASKLGSVVVHAEEAVGPTGHHFDVEAIRGLLSDPEIVAWLDTMRAMALLPVKR